MMTMNKTISLAVAAVLLMITLAAAAQAGTEDSEQGMLTQIKAQLAKASDSARIGADDRGVWQRDAILGRMRSNTMREKFKDPLLRWEQIDGARVNGDEGDYWVQVSSVRLPMFWIRLGSFTDKADAQRLADLILDMANSRSGE